MMNVLKRSIVLIFALFLTIIITSAQQVRFERNNFPGKEAELSQALKNIAQGEDLFYEAEVSLTGKGLDLRYASEVKNTITDALNHFLQANDFNPQSAPLNMMIGKCYLYLEDSKKALTYFHQAKSLDEQAKDIDFLIGWCYQLSGDVDEAIAAYDIAMRRNNTLASIQTITVKLKECHYAKSLMEDALDLSVENVESINTADAEFFPLVMEQDKYLFFERFVNDKTTLYMSTRTADGWSTAVPTGQVVNVSTSAVLSEVTLLSPEGKSIATKWFALNNAPRENDARYLAVAAIAPDGNTAYFPSNRYSLYGGFDICTTQRNKKGQWERPRAMENTIINTPGDEYGVALSPDGTTLYFSSNGFPSMGGYDVYKSTYDGKRWSKAENLGFPINSQTDDVLHSISNDGNRLYFSSVRTGGKGNHDMYMVNFVPGVIPPVEPSVNIGLTAEAAKEPVEEPIEEPVEEPVAPPAPIVVAPAPTSVAPIVDLHPVDIAISKDKTPTAEDIPAAPQPVNVQHPASLRGFITDTESYLPVNTSLKLTDLIRNTEENIDTDTKGTFQTTLTAGNTYKLTVTVEGYKPYAEEFAVEAVAGQKLSKYIKLEPLISKVPETVAANDPVPTVQVENDEEQYEDDIVVLSPLIPVQPTAKKVEPELQSEQPVRYTGLLSNNRTFQPVTSALIKITNKATSDQTIVYSDTKGIYDFTVASGNSYTLVIESRGYQEYSENFEVAVGNIEPDVTHHIQLTALVEQEVQDRSTIEKPVHYTTLMGDVLDSQNNPLANVALNFTDVNTQHTVLATTNNEGMYTIALPAGSNYNVVLTAAGYTEIKDNITTPSSESTQRLAKDFHLTSLVAAVEPEPEPVLEPVTTTAQVEPAPVEEPEPVVVEEPTPVIVPEPEPVVEPEPVPVEEPQPVVEPEPQPEPVVAPEPEPVVEPEPVPVEEPEPVVVEEPTPVIVPEPIPVEEPQPVVEPAPAPVPVKEEPKPEVKKAPQMMLAGVVTGKSKQPVRATIVITDISRGLVETVMTDNKGIFHKEVLKGSDYSITVKAVGYQNWVKDIPAFDDNDEIDMPVDLRSVEGTLLATLPFDLDRASLSDEASQTLDKLLNTLKKQEKTISIYSYTDNYGGDGYNTRLAERRLKSVSSYLNTKGVVQDKMNTEIVGPNAPAITNLTLDGRKSNNRVEIWIN